MEYGKYKIEGDKVFALYVIKPISKGSVPKALTGRYSSVGDAIQAIKANEAKNVRSTNAKTKSNSGV